MEKGNQSQVILLSILVLFLCFLTTESVFAYGGDGGEPRDPSASDSAIGTTKNSDVVKKYTREELETFFSGLPDGVREMVIDKQKDKLRTPAQLNLIRNIFLDAESWNQKSQEAIWQSYEEVAVVLDQAGQKAELVLALTSGGTSSAAVKFITGTLFGATRSGLNELNQGKSTGEILQAIAVTIAVDKIMGADGIKKLTDRGGRLVDMVSRAADLNKNPQVKKYLIQVGLKAGLYKTGEKLTKDTIGAILNSMVTQTQKVEVHSTQPPMTTYMGPGEYDVTPSGQKLYK